jgi:GNAT superfamily N-acetyltransferase
VQSVGRRLYRRTGEVSPVRAKGGRRQRGQDARRSSKGGLRTGGRSPALARVTAVQRRGSAGRSRRESGRRRDTRPVGRSSDGDFAFFAVESILALNEEGTAGLGIARYVRHVSRPDAAEVAVTVIDDWQGRGLGTLLLEAVSGRARKGSGRSPR